MVLNIPWMQGANVTIGGLCKKYRILLQTVSSYLTNYILQQDVQNEKDL